MKNVHPGWWVAAVIGLFAVFVPLGSYNNIVGDDNAVKAGWSEVANQYRNMNDKIPALVETVKGYAAHEKTVFENVATARAAVGKITVTGAELERNLELQKQMDGLTAALSRLIALREAYPQLRAVEQFNRLSDEISGSVNRIGTARTRAIEATKSYNTRIERVPGVFVAKVAGYKARDYYTIPESEQKAPQVKF